MPAQPQKPGVMVEIRNDGQLTPNHISKIILPGLLAVSKTTISPKLPREVQ